MKEKFVKKYLFQTIEAIRKVSEGGQYYVKLKYSDINSDKHTVVVCPISIENNENKDGLRFRIKLKNDTIARGIKYKESYGLSEELVLYNETSKLYIGSNSVVDFKTSLPKGNPLELEGVFTRFSKPFGKIYKLSYRRSISRLGDEHPTFPTLVIARSKLIKYDIKELNTQSDGIFGFRFKTLLAYCIEVKINNEYFHLYAIDDYKTLIIDSTHKIEALVFSKVSYIIRTAFAFLCGKLYGGEVTTVSYSDKNLKNIKSVAFNQELPTSITNNAIVNYQYFFDYVTNHKIEGYKSEHHDYFSHELFSTLCEKMFNNTEFLRSIQLLLNASSTDSSIQKGALYSVSIETLVNFVENNILLSAPISDKKIAKQLRHDLKNVLLNYESLISEEATKIISKRIDNINQKTNTNRLIAPFELLGVKLSTKDLEIINHRNAYLHGNKPDGLTEKFDLEPIAVHLHYLISILILKYIGYAGHIIYLPNWIYFYSRSHLNYIKMISDKILRMANNLNKINYNISKG